MLKNRSYDLSTSISTLSRLEIEIEKIVGPPLVLKYQGSPVLVFFLPVLRNQKRILGFSMYLYVFSIDLCRR